MKKLILLILATACVYGCKKKEKTTEPANFTPYYYKASSLPGSKSDSALFYYYRSADSSTIDLEKIYSYIKVAEIQIARGDLLASQDILTKSLKLLDEKKDKDHPYFLSIYNLLGRSSLDLKNYDAAITYFKQAGLFLPKGQSNSTLLNNIAVAYQKIKNYDKAITILQASLDSSKSDTIGYARALSNLGRTKSLQDSSYNAAPELITALKLREIKSYKAGIATSYAHLSDYYARSHPDSSFFFAKKMYELVESPDDKIEALQKLIRVGPEKSSKDYFERYQYLNDSLQTARNASKYQFSMIRYETEKNKTENLRLQQANTKQRFYLFTIAAVGIILFGISIAWYRRRKRKIEWKAQHVIKESQLKTSKKVHDVVANGLYRIMTNLEHKASIEKEPLLDEIETLYEQSRDISYDQPVQQTGEYSAKIHLLLSAFGTDSTKVLIAGNQENVWNMLSGHERKELEYVLQELMVNMSKHSKARNVVIRFTGEKDNLHVHYKDDGVGLMPNFQFGNGLRNTENRIKNLKGTIIFDGTTGLKIEISLPTGKDND